MKKALITGAISLLSISIHAKETIKEHKEGASLMQAGALCFIENKGQIIDQNKNPRPDIDYKLDGGDMMMFIGKGQIHYQWSKPVSSPDNYREQLALGSADQIANHKSKIIIMSITAWT